MFWKFENKDMEPPELRIDGEIVDDDDAWAYELMGIKSKSPNKFKEELEKYKGKPLTVWIDSYGGNVFAAAGIYNALMEHKGSVTVKIDGKAMSAASVIAMAGTEIQMSPVALMMIHNPLTYAEGDSRDMRKTAEVLDVVKETIINAYQIKTNKSRSKMGQMMDDETWMDAKTAVKEGFADTMMYDEKEKVYNFAFNRRAILNSSKESMMKILKEPDKPENPPDDIELYKSKLTLENLL